MSSSDRAPPLTLPPTAPTAVKLRAFDPGRERQPAKRVYFDHKVAMAVLAYHYKWDRFVNQELRQLNYLREFDESNWKLEAARYVPMFAFFCPLNLLNALMERYNARNDTDGGPLRDREIEIHLPPNPPPRGLGLTNPACDPRLVIANVSTAIENTITDMITDIIRTAGRDQYSDEAGAWHATVGTIVEYLRVAASPIAPISARLIAPISARLPGVLQRFAPVSFTKTVVWRGLLMPNAMYDPKRMAVGMRDVFVSTTDYRVSTRPFVGAGTEDQPGVAAPGVSWQLCLLVDSDVNVIEVGNHLPDGWLCFTSEREVIIAPGAYYTIASEKTIAVGDAGYFDLAIPFQQSRENPRNFAWEADIRRFVVNVSSRPP